MATGITACDQRLEDAAGPVQAPFTSRSNSTRFVDAWRAVNVGNVRKFGSASEAFTGAGSAGLCLQPIVSVAARIGLLSRVPDTMSISVPSVGRAKGQRQNFTIILAPICGPSTTTPVN